jgi:hypothetical protein
MSCRNAATLLLFVGLAIAHTWPLASAPAHLSRNDNADAMLNEWTLAWIAHQLPRDPLRLFDANIFHPERNTLAFSEHLLLPAIAVAPLVWSGASPVLAFNLLLLAGFALSGWAMSLVVTRWSGDRMAGVLAGSLYAFNAHTLTRLPHVQAVHTEFLPIAMLALDHVLRAPGIRPALALGTAAALQSLTSGYLMVFTLLAGAAGALVRLSEWTRRTGIALALAAGLTMGIMLPVLLPYRAVRNEQRLVRSLDEVALYSAAPREYLTTTGRLHYGLWSAQFYRRRDALFPGVASIALAAVAIGTGVAVRDRRARMWLAAAAAGFVLSFGPAIPAYVWLYDAVPLLQGLRAASRFGFLTLAGLAVLAAFGLRELRRRLPASGAVILGVSTIALAHVEALTAPNPYIPYTGIPRVYDAVASVPRAVIAEFPFPSEHRTPSNARYMLASTRHWHPMLNGYSGFVPDRYVEHARALAGFPDDASFEALTRAGVTHIVVHLDAMPGVSGALRARGLPLVASSPPIMIFSLK